MAISIYIYEKDPFIFESVKQRLTHYFPDSYIINPFIPTNSVSISDFTVILYDERNYRIPSNNQDTRCEYISLFSLDENKQSIIDCSRIYCLIKNIENNLLPQNTNSTHGKLEILLPFAYIDERENFINNTFISTDSNNDFSLRIDLCSGIRMPSSFKTGMDCGSLTDLLDEVVKNNFTPEKILDYLNPDISGFLTPGKPLHPDDVFDVNISNIHTLLSQIKELVNTSVINSNALVIVEGWKTSDLINFACYCDNFHILLPDRMSDEMNGIKDLVNAIKRKLPTNSNLIIHYCEDYRKETTNERTRV